MDSSFHTMKPIFAKELQAHLKKILIPFKTITQKEEIASDGEPFLNINIIFPGAYSNLNAFVSNKTFRCGIAAGIGKNNDDKKFFRMRDYLKHKNIPGIEKLSFDIRHTRYANGFNSALNFIVDIYNGSLKSVLLGEAWEDIPFDWGDYK